MIIPYVLILINAIASMVVCFHCICVLTSQKFEFSNRRLWIYSMFLFSSLGVGLTGFSNGINNIDTTAFVMNITLSFYFINAVIFNMKRKIRV